MTLYIDLVKDLKDRRLNVLAEDLILTKKIALDEEFLEPDQRHVHISHIEALERLRNLTGFPGVANIIIIEDHVPRGKRNLKSILTMGDLVELSPQLLHYIQQRFLYGHVDSETQNVLPLVTTLFSGFSQERMQAFLDTQPDSARESLPRYDPTIDFKIVMGAPTAERISGFEKRFEEFLQSHKRQLARFQSRGKREWTFN